MNKYSEENPSDRSNKSYFDDDYEDNYYDEYDDDDDHCEEKYDAWRWQIYTQLTQSRGPHDDDDSDTDDDDDNVGDDGHDDDGDDDDDFDDNVDYRFIPNWPRAKFLWQRHALQGIN